MSPCNRKPWVSWGCWLVSQFPFYVLKNSCRANSKRHLPGGEERRNQKGHQLDRGGRWGKFSEKKVFGTHNITRNTFMWSFPPRSTWTTRLGRPRCSWRSRTTTWTWPRCWWSSGGRGRICWAGRREPRRSTWRATGDTPGWPGTVPSPWNHKPFHYFCSSSFGFSFSFTYFHFAVSVPTFLIDPATFSQKYWKIREISNIASKGFGTISPGK